MTRRILAPPLLAVAALMLAVAGCGGDGSSSSDRTAESDPPPAASTPSETPSSSGGAATPTVGSAGKSYQAAPDFTLERVDGGQVTLSELRGQVVLIDFWATWCGPCRRGIPHLNSMYEKFKDDGFEIVGVSVDRPSRGLSSKELVTTFMQKQPMNYVNVLATAEVARAYGGIRSIPTAFLVDRDGRIRQSYVGLQRPEVLEHAVKELLAEKASETTSI
jgi:cytochrome c biogenesis protein CcmG/thiol:disulfide interchange protein DsbE